MANDFSPLKVEKGDPREALHRALLPGLGLHRQLQKLVGAQGCQYLRAALLTFKRFYNQQRIGGRQGYKTLTQVRAEQVGGERIIDCDWRKLIQKKN